MDVATLGLLGKTVARIVRNDETPLQPIIYEWRRLIESHNLVFYTDCGKIYAMHHAQDCCECVSIEDIVGSLDDLIGSPLTMAEVVSESKQDDDGSETWTFYKFATVKGYVTVRWYGSSNGFYSEGVDFDEVVPC
jgi:hypothetical protein